METLLQDLLKDLEIDLLKACRAKGEVQAVQAFHHLPKSLKTTPLCHQRRCSGSETMELLEHVGTFGAQSGLLSKKKSIPPSHGNFRRNSHRKMLMNHEIFGPPKPSAHMTRAAQWSDLPWSLRSVC